ncbi:Gfo/Idh/MocA family oxidoreductase [Mycobacterium sp. 4D054]|uniref:Gfo/Idh/MocA family oxidoreductase n=1 Tax=unclassified Mycobacterium TaxID=2642494 RepID=UPI0021B466C3|nr:Gfo/Idh/MocA family oxidoreductase [Mycobacterium sp. SMC-8]UXA14664.1 Gfo/Idh/MocA family oxidoreductase [Mycobacterium sp. SMC-8]
MTVRVGVIGVGVMGADHARKLNGCVAGAAVTAVADVNADAAARIAAQMRGATVRENGFALIDSDDVDAVVIASHDSTHADLALAAVKAGKPVLCEKPLAPTASEASIVVEAERAARGSLIGLGFMRRFDPAYTELKAVVDSGELGPILVSHCVSRTVEAYPGGDSASTVTNAAIHELDVMPWLLGSPVTSVTWHCGRTSSRSGMRQDPQIMLLRTASDVLITVEVFLNAGYGYDTRCEVVGEDGTAALTLPAHVVRDSQSTRGIGYPENWLSRYADAYRIELQEWIDSIEKGRPSTLATAEDGLQAALVADAVIESMNNGGAPVAVS